MQATCEDDGLGTSAEDSGTGADHAHQGWLPRSDLLNGCACKMMMFHPSTTSSNNGSENCAQDCLRAARRSWCELRLCDNSDCKQERGWLTGA
jgi:hypothetical protein